MFCGFGDIYLDRQAKNSRKLLDIPIPYLIVINYMLKLSDTDLAIGP